MLPQFSFIDLLYVRFLIEEGKAEVHGKVSALLYAARYGNLDVVNYLLSRLKNS